MLRDVPPVQTCALELGYAFHEPLQLLAWLSVPSVVLLRVTDAPQVPQKSCCVTVKAWTADWRIVTRGCCLGHREVSKLSSPGCRCQAWCC